MWLHIVTTTIRGFSETHKVGKVGIMANFFLKNFLNICWTHVHFWGHWYPVLDFWWCLLRVSKPEWVLPYLHLAEAYVIYTFTSGVTPLPVYNASIAASHLPHMRVSAEVGCQDLNHRHPARQSDALPTRPRHHGQLCIPIYLLFSSSCATHVNLKLDISEYNTITFQDCRLHWTSSLLMTLLKRRWQYLHFFIVETLSKGRNLHVF